MEQVRLGNTGLFVSRICLGMMSYAAETPTRPWMLDEAAAEPIVRAAVEGGITFFDTADMYSQGGSEIATGRLLPKFLSRDELAVATKVRFEMTPGPTGRGLSRKHVLAAIDASLSRLGMEYVDLLPDPSLGPGGGSPRGALPPAPRPRPRVMIGACHEPRSTAPS
jgi:1-deoxyxylulose-5-phosphate synthase